MKVPDREDVSEITLTSGASIETLNNINHMRVWSGEPYGSTEILNMETPEEVDELIEALTYARMLMTHGPLSGIPSAFDGKLGREAGYGF